MKPGTLFLALFFLVSLSLPAAAFRSISPNVHDGIVREAFDGLGFSSGFVKCVSDGGFYTDWDETSWGPLSGLTTTDEYNASHHFDRHTADPDGSNRQVHEETFNGGREHVCSIKSTVVSELAACRGDYKSYCTSIGQSLHAIQDFFSHSNFIDLTPAEQQQALDALLNCNGRPPANLSFTYFGTETDYYEHDANSKDEAGKPGFDRAREAARNATRAWILKIREELISADVEFKWQNLIGYNPGLIFDYKPPYTRENYPKSATKVSDGLLKVKTAHVLKLVKSISPELSKQLEREKVNVILQTPQGNAKMGLDFASENLFAENLAPFDNPTLELTAEGKLFEQLSKAEDPVQALKLAFKKGYLVLQGKGIEGNLKALAINSLAKTLVEDKEAEIYTAVPANPTNFVYGNTPAQMINVRGKPAVKIENSIVLTTNLGVARAYTSPKIVKITPPKKTVYSTTAGFYKAPVAVYKNNYQRGAFVQLTAKGVSASRNLASGLAYGRTVSPASGVRTYYRIGK